MHFDPIKNMIIEGDRDVRPKAAPRTALADPLIIKHKVDSSHFLKRLRAKQEQK